MKQEFYIITHTLTDEYESEAKLVGAYSSLEDAVENMRESIYDTFEDNKEWWEEEDEDEDYIEEQYIEWINEQYTDEEQTYWTYTSDDPEEHIFKIHHVETEKDIHEAYAVLCTCVDGEDNRTEILGVYVSADEATEAMEEFEAENDCDDEENDWEENIFSVEEFSIK